ncbi:MAG TPA: methionyl-tRNA formyltransferase [Cytophagales bacterium]|nr:methionyl-tRNA formyltransferase [Cytophagales bacterium]
MSEKLRIIFMGTPEFAVPSLKILYENNYDIVAVITAPDKPSGRGLKLTASPVKEYAVANGLNILQPTNLKNPEFLAYLKSLNANLQIVVAFRMLPEAVWSMPKFGTFNLHASLLPQYRGAAPINWAIINGEKETGATTFFLQHEIDTGDLIFQEKEPILEQDNVETLYERLKEKGAGLVLKTIQGIEKGEIHTIPQNMTPELKSAPKIFKETCEISWNKTGREIYNFVRGLSPYPTAWSTLNGKFFKIYKTSFIPGSHSNKAPGEIISDGKTFIHVACQDGLISLEELQMEGKKKMIITEFLRGNKI